MVKKVNYEKLGIDEYEDFLLEGQFHDYGSEDIVFYLLGNLNKNDDKEFWSALRKVEEDPILREFVCGYPSEPEDYGEWLRIEREHFHLSQTKLGEKVGVSLKTINRYEIGEEMPDTPVKERLEIKLARYFYKRHIMEKANEYEFANEEGYSDPYYESNFDKNSGIYKKVKTSLDRFSNDLNVRGQKYFWDNIGVISLIEPEFYEAIKKYRELLKNIDSDEFIKKYGSEPVEERTKKRIEELDSYYKFLDTLSKYSFGLEFYRKPEVDEEEFDIGDLWDFSTHIFQGYRRTIDLINKDSSVIKKATMFESGEWEKSNLKTYRKQLEELFFENFEPTRAMGGFDFKNNIDYALKLIDKERKERIKAHKMADKRIKSLGPCIKKSVKKCTIEAIEKEIAEKEIKTKSVLSFDSEDWFILSELIKMKYTTHNVPYRYYPTRGQDAEFKREIDIGKSYVEFFDEFGFEWRKVCSENEKYKIKNLESM